MKKEPKRVDFECFKSGVCHRLVRMGDITFLIDVLQNDEISTLFNRKWCAESLYLLAMVDYISRINDVPLCNKYDDLRCLRFEKRIYPSSIIAMCAVFGNDDAKRQADEEAIPEFLRHNIVEADVRNVG